jgi:hypothetical protein
MRRRAAAQRVQDTLHTQLQACDVVAERVLAFARWRPVVCLVCAANAAGRVHKKCHTLDLTSEMRHAMASCSTFVHAGLAAHVGLVPQHAGTPQPRLIIVAGANMSADHLRSALLLAGALLASTMLLQCADSAETAGKPGRPSWDEMQKLYPGIRRDGPACDAPGQDGCPTDQESGFRPTWYGTEDGKDPFADGAYLAAAQQASRGGGGAPLNVAQRPARPSGDAQYRAAVDAALDSAAATPLKHFHSGLACELRDGRRGGGASLS